MASSHLTQDACAKQDRKRRSDGFNAARIAQKAKGTARRGPASGRSGGCGTVWSTVRREIRPPRLFWAMTRKTAEGQIAALISGRGQVTEVKQGLISVPIAAEQTPFYAETAVRSGTPHDQKTDRRLGHCLGLTRADGGVFFHSAR